MIRQMVCFRSTPKSACRSCRCSTGRRVSSVLFPSSKCLQRSRAQALKSIHRPGGGPWFCQPPPHCGGPAIQGLPIGGCCEDEPEEAPSVPGGGGADEGGPLWPIHPPEPGPPIQGPGGP